MRIINKLDGAGCGKGVEELTKQVIQNSKLDCTEVIIEDYEFAKRVTLEIDEADYTIRIWNFHPLDNDKNGHICRAVISYTLWGGGRAGSPCSHPGRSPRATVTGR